MRPQDYADSQLKIAQWKANLPMLLDAFAELALQYPIVAKQYRLYYLALVEAGFSTEEAMDIVITHGVVPKLTGGSIGDEKV